MQLVRMLKVIRSPILIGSLVGFVAFALLGVFGSGAERPHDVLVVTAGGALFGVVGAIVGGLIGIPIYLGFKKESEQDQLEKDHGLRIDSEKPIKRFLGMMGVVLGVGLLVASFYGFPAWMNFPQQGAFGLAVLFIFAGWSWLKNKTYGG